MNLNESHEKNHMLQYKQSVLSNTSVYAPFSLVAGKDRTYSNHPSLVLSLNA